MADFLTLFRSNAGNLKERTRGIANSIERARQRREDLLTLPLPPSDVADILCQIIDHKASGYTPRLLNKIDFLIKDPRVVAGSQAVQVAGDLLIPAEGQNHAGVADIETMLAYMFGEQIKAGIRKALEDSKYECGPARAVRDKELQSIELQLASLQKQQNEAMAELEAMRSELQ